MADRTHAEKYLSTAKAIHAHLEKNWRPDRNGGVVWCEDADKQKANAITNNLFIILSARLYTRTREARYLEWAERGHAWIAAQALFDGKAMVDGPGHHGDYWNSNQGTYLGALAALYEATGRAEFLDEGVRFAESMLTRAGLTRPDGVIVEKLGTRGDASLFKGIFVRYLGQFRDLLNARHVHPETAKLLDQTIHASVASLLQHGVAEDGFFRAEWHAGAKDQATGFNAQLSALIALTAVFPPPAR
jgi:predicted alpha-1,6-mannanase (GH76 family)